MTGIKISALPSAAALTGVEQLPVVQSTATVKATIDGVFTSVANTAARVVNTPSGTIAATTVQGAINELDTEKAALISPVFTTPALGAATATSLAASGAIAMFGAALTTSQVSGLTTVGAASLSTSQLSALTTSQLSALCTNNDLIFSALKRIGIAI